MFSTRSVTCANRAFVLAAVAVLSACGGNPVGVDQSPAAGAVLVITTPASLPDGSKRRAYSTTLEVLGGASANQWMVVAGTFPPGLTLQANTGIVSGAPVNSGEFVFMVRVTNGDKVTTQSFRLTVTSGPRAGYQFRFQQTCRDFAGIVVITCGEMK